MRDMGNFEIGRKPISNLKLDNLKLDCRQQDTVGTDVSMSLRVQFQISDFGFEMGFRPISKFPFSRWAACTIALYGIRDFDANLSRATGNRRSA